MRIPTNLRRSTAGTAGSIPFVSVQLALAATALLVMLAGLSLALLSPPKSHSPAPAFLSAALGERSHSASSRSTAATRTFGQMKTSVVRGGVRVAAPWAHAELTSLDAGHTPWSSFAGGASRTTSFGSESVTLGGIDAEEFLTVTRRQGPRTWRWSLDSSSRPRVTPDGQVEFLDAHGRPVLMHIEAPAILGRNGKRLATGPLHWHVTTMGGRNLLTLHVDDTNLPLPYTIDPAITLTGSAYSVVKGAGQKTGTFALNVPAGSQTGDTLVVQLVVRTASAITTPSGWTLLASKVDSTNGLAQYMYLHTMLSTDTVGSTVFSVTTPTGTDAAGGVVALRNVDASPTNPAQASNSGNGTSTTASATVTTDAFVGSNNDYVMAFYGGMGQIGFTENNASMSPVWTSTSENQMPNGSGQYTSSNSNVSSGSSGASRADSLVTAGSFGAGVAVTPSATISTSSPWIMNVLAFRVALPWNQALPTISGTVAVGQTLTAATGTWSNTPTGYTYQWQDCDATGNNCVNIAGATGSTYVLASTDSGSTVKVQVTASNANGTGQTATSTQTATVPAPNGSGTLTTPTSTVTAGSTGNTVVFTYTAAAGGMSAGKVQLTIPSGWTAPSTTGANAGYTTASTGTVAVAGQVVTVSNVTLAAGATMTITYGSKASGGAGATASTTAGAQTWSAAQASTNVTAVALASSPSITVNPAAATKVVWTTQPTTTGAGSSISPSPAASIEDTYGNVVTSSTANVTAAIGTNPGGGTLSGTATVAAVAGVATFSNLSIDKVGTGYTLTAASSGLTGATSSAFNITVGSPAKLAFVQGPTTVAAGSSISPAVTVAIQDAAGNTVTTSSASVTMAIGTNPAGGTLSGTTTVNAVNGVATFSTLSLDKAGTGYTLSASSGTLTSATSGSFNVNAGAASKLAFVQNPTSATAGATISPSITVAVTDALGNTVTSSSASITLAIGTNPGGGTLSGTKTVNAASGIATFSTLSIDKAGTGYTLTASGTGLASATSSAFNINVGAVSSTQSTVSASASPITANGVASSTITVTAKDAFGNPVSGQTVSLSQGTGSSTITTVSGTTSGTGVATFTVTDTKAETVTYSATVGATGVLQTASVQFTAGAVSAGKSTVAASPTSVTADGSTTSTVTVTLLDANSNPVAGKTVSLGKSGGSSTITAVSPTTNASGQATFTVKDTAAENTTYTATDTTDTLTVTQTAAVTFTAGPVSAVKSTVAASPTSVTADGSTTSTVTVTLLDANSNPVAGKTVSLGKSGGSSTITAVSPTTNASGQATFTVKDTAAENTTYTATDTTDAVTVTQTAAVTFAPGMPTAGGSTLTASPTPVTANGVASSTATVTLKDANGNVVPGKTVTLGGAPAGSSISPVSATTNASGQATFTITSTTAGSYTYTATDTTDAVAVTQTAGVVFTAGAVSAGKSTVAASPTSVTADGSTTSTVTVTLLDANSNPVAGKTVSLAKGSGSSTVTAVSPTTNASGQATFTVKDTVAENTTYTATDTTDSVAVTQQATVTFVAGPVTAAQSTVSASPATVTADGTTTSTVTVTLRDANSNPVAGKTVSLAKSGGSSVVTAVSSTTNASGQATFTVKDTVAEPTTYTATDTTDSVTVTQQATVTFTVGAVSASASTVVAAPTTLTADGTSTSTVTVTLKDATGNAVSGKSVTLAASPNGSSISPASATTNASGQASFTVSSTAAGSVNYSATDTTDSIAVTQKATVAYNAGAVSATQSTVAASASPVTANGVATSTITVTAKDAFGNPVAGQSVSLSQGSGSSTITTVTGTTTASGVATFTVKDTKAENVTYSATVGATSVLQTAAVQFIAGPVTAAQSTATASPGSVTADGSTSSTVTVTLNDANSNPVAGKTVTLVKTGGSSTVTTVSGTTNAAGQATFTVTDTVAELSKYTATDTTDSVTVTQQPSVTFTSGAATHFTVSAPAGATAGTGFGVTVTAYDANNNVATGYSGTVHLTSSDGRASLPADLSATAGVATFSGVTLKTSGAQTVTATDGSVTGTSSSIAVAAASASSLTVSTPASATAGTAFGATVTAYDAYGNVATGYSGTVHLTSSDGRAVLPVDVTASAGVASFSGLKLKTAGTQTVSAGDGSLSATSGSIAVAAASAASFTLGAPASATAGTGFGLTVTAYDAYGNLANGYTGTVHLTSGDGRAVLPADVSASNGVATFAGVQLRTSGTQSVTAADGTVTGTANVAVSPAAAASFDVTAPANATAGAGVSVTVTARDAYGNVATGYGGTVHLTSSDAKVALPADASATNGTVTFNGVTLKTSGSQTVSAADGSVTGTSGSIAVAAASAAALKLTGPATATAGTPVSVTVTAYDAYGNVATGYTGSHPITFSGASSSGSPVTAPTVTDASGTAVAFGSATQLTFAAGASTAGGSMTLYAAENATVSVTDGTLPTASGGALSVAVSSGSLSKFAFTLAPSQVNGAAFTGTNTLTAEDAYGNTVTSFDAFADHVTISANGALTGAVSGLDGGNALTATPDFSAGVATLGGLLTYTGSAGSGTFTATAGTGQSGTSGSVTIAAGAAAGFALTGAATQTAGQPQSVGIRAVDASGNTATTYTGDHTLTFGGASSIGTFTPTVTDKSGAAVALGSPATITFANGVATAGGSLVLYKVESASISATEGALATAPANRLAVSVGAGSASSLGLAAATTSPTAGTADALTITAYDAYGNVATGYSGDQSLTFGGATAAGSYVPTVTDTSGTPVAFGTPTTVRFTNGVSSLGGSLKLYTAETASVTVSDGSHGNGTGTSFTVGAAPAASLAVSSVNGGSNPTAGVSFPVVVRSLDTYGNRSAVASNTALALSVAAGTGSLGGTTTGTLSSGQSQATISGVTYTKAESGVRIGVARTSGDALASGTSSAFTVAATADRLLVSSVNGGSAPTAGQPFSVTVQAQDGLGNTSNVASDTTVTMSVYAGSGTLGGTVTATIPAGQSQATVSGLTYDVAEGGVQLRASATGGDSLLAATSSAFSVQPGTATHFGLTGSGTETAGAPNALTITAYDAYGNVATGYTGDHSLTFSGASTIGSWTPTATDKSGSPVGFGSSTTVSFANGVSTAGASLVLYRAETAHVSAADGSVVTTTPLTVTVSAASATSLAVAAAGSSVAGGTFTTTVTALDPYGNTDTSFAGNVTLGSSDPNAVLPAATAASGGIASFTGVKLETAGTQTVTAGSGSLNGSASVAVTPGSATHFAVVAPASATAGSGFGLTVRALDAYGNLDTSYGSSVHLSSGDPQAVLPGDASASGGVATFAGVQLDSAGTQAVDASAGSLTGEATVVVGAAAATHLSVAAPASATAGSGFAVTVHALDPYGNTDTSFAGSVGLGSGDAQATLPAAQAASGGVATFAGVKLGTAGSQTVTASGGSLNGSANVAVAAGAATHLSVSAPASATAGSGFGVTVTALDAYGNTDTSYAGSVHLSSADTNATFPGDTAASSGVATFAGVKLGTAGTEDVSATSGSLTGAVNVSVAAGAATHFAVSAPSSATAGTGFGVTVTALDAYGNTDTSFSGTVHLASDDARATMPADVSVSGGVATFAGVKLGSAGSDSLDASAGSVTGTASVSVSAAAATHLVVSAPASATAGAAFGVTVTAEDGYGNTDTSFGGTVHLASGDTNATVPVNVSASSGVASFTGMTLGTAGSQSVDATSGALSGSASVGVAPGAATALSVSTSAASAAAGDPLDVTVTAKDAYGNVATGYRGSVALASTDGRATLAPGHSFVAGDAGTYTFAGGATFATAGTQTVTASDSTLSGTSGNVAVSAGTPAALVYGAQPSNVAAGSAISPAVTVRVVDAYGNPAASNAAITLSIAPGTGATGATLSGTLTENAVGGVATFGDLSLDKAAAGYELDASASGLAGAQSSAFAVGPGAADAADSTLSVAPSSVTADGSSAATVTVRAYDAFGNALHSGGATVALSTTLGTLSAVTDNGDGTYTASLTSTAAGNATITGTLGGATLANGGSATFNPGGTPSAARSSISAAPTSLTAGGSSTLTVQARDAFGNDLGSGGATVVLSTDLGSIGTVTDNGDGTYTATLTSNVSGTAHVTGTINGSAIGTGASVAFAPGAVDAAHSTVGASPASPTAGTSSTITVRLADAYGNPLPAGGDTVLLATDLGTLSSVVDNHDGTYTATLSSTATGAAHVTGTVNGAALAGTTVTFGAAAADASRSTLAASPSSLAAGSPATVTVTLEDGYGNRLTSGGDDVRLSTDLGTLSSVTDNRDGTYTATLSSTGTGVAHVTGTVNGGALTGTTVGFTPAGADATTSTLAVAPASVTAGSTSSVTVTLKDAYGNRLTAGGDNVQLSTDLGSLSGVTDNHDGTYTATLDSTVAGDAHVTGTVNGAALTGATVHYAVGTADAAHSSVSAAPASLTAGSTTTVTVRLADAYGNALTTGGDNVQLSTDRGTVSSVTDNQDGTYTATLRSTSAGDAHVTGTVDGAALTGTTVTFTPGAADASQSTMSASPASLDAGSSSTVTVTLKDAFGNRLAAGGDAVTIATDLGTASSVTDNHDGTYTATLDSTVAGDAHVSGTVDGAALAGATVTFTPGAADASRSAVSASPPTVAAGSSSTVTVRLKDAYGNPLVTGGDAVTVASDHGTVGTVVDNGDGTYTATVDSTVVGDAHVTASLGATTIGSVTITFTPAAVDASTSSLVVSPSSLAAGSPATITVSLKDAYGNALTAGGDDVQLSTDLGTLSSVTDNGNGTYTATLSSTSTGTAHLTGTVDGAALAGATTTFVPGAASGTTSTLGVSPATTGVDSPSTVTVRLKDANGNALTAGGDSVQLSTDLGRLSSVTDNGDGSYTASLDSTATGYAHVTGTVNGAALTGATVTFRAGAPDASKSTLAAAPSSVAAGSSATLTVRLEDSHGNAITTGGDTVQLTSDLGTVSGVTDNHDGTYTATLTSTSTGTAHVSGTVNGAALAGTTVDVTPGAADAGKSSLSASPSATTADSGSTITVRLADAYGNPLVTGGDDVQLSTDLGSIGAVTDNGNGTYTATVTSAATGTAHIGGTVNGAALAATTVSFAPGAVSSARSAVSAGASSVSTDAAGTTVTVTVTDAHGNPIPGSHVTLAPDGGSSTIDPILGTDTDASGIATFTVADTTAETVVYSATASGTLVTQTAAVQYLPGAADGAHSSIAAAPTSFTAGGSSTVTVRLRDQHGNALTSGGNAVAVATDLGTVSSVSDDHDGTYTATLSSTTTGTAHVTATVGGAAVSGSASVTVDPAAPNAGQSTIAASPSKINADGTSGDATITVHARDAYGNAVKTGGASVALASTMGNLSSVTDNGDGTYTATLSATGAIGTANVTGTLGGTAIGGSANVQLAPPVPTAIVDSAPTGTVATASATFTFHSGNDPGATFECRIDSGSFSTCTSPQTYSGLADGAHTFAVRGVNVNGPGTPVTASWTSDITPPTVALTTAPGAYTNNTTEPLAASASDATSGVASVDFLFAATAAACPTGTLIATVTAPPYSTTWTLPADGSYVVCAVSHDGAGNASTAATSAVVVDTTKPTITFPVLGTQVGSDYWVRGSVDLHTTSFDQTSGVASVGYAYAGATSGTIGTVTGAGTGGTTDPYDQTWDTTGVADGPYTVTATTTDKATNSNSASQVLNVDNTPPTASLDDPGQFGHGTIPLTVTASDTGSGVNTAATLVQSSPHGADTWTTIADPSTWTPADGNYDLRAVVTDNVGNQTITDLRTILVDNTPPTVTNDADSAWHANDVTVTLDAVDNESGVQSVQYQIDGGSWQDGTSVSIPAPADGSNDGTHTITYHATNRAGVTSADASATVNIDHTPPSNVTLDAPNAGSLLHGTLDSTQLSGTAQDATSGIASTSFRIAPAGSLGSNPCNTYGTAISAPFDTKSVADGSYDMWYVGIDAAGNGRCSVVPHTVTIDNTPPVTTDDAPFAAQNSDVTVHLHATDATSGVASTEYSVDGGGWTTGSDVTIGAPSDHSNDGTHTIRYRSTDNAGNVESTERATVIIDTTAPSGTADDPNSLLSGTVQLSASPTDPDIASVEWLYRSVGSSSWNDIGTDTAAPWELPWITSAVPDGAYDLEAISTDSTGNTTTQLFSTKTVDNSPPDSAAITAPNANADLHGTIAFSSTATDSTSGIDTSKTEYQVKATGDSDFRTVSGSSWDSTSAPDGPAEVRVAVWDRAGNGPLYSDPVTFTVDNTAPTVHLSAPSATNGSASLGASGSADIASVEYDYRPHGGSSWTTITTQGSPFDATWSTSGLPEGLYDVQVTATDHGGNTGTDSTTVLVDRTAPTVSLTQPASGTTVGGSSVALAASASDADSGVASVVYRYRPHGTGSFTAISGSSWDVTGIPSGDYDVQALVTDKAGNTATDTTTVTVDSTPPSVSAFAVASPQHATTTLHVTTDGTAAKVVYGIAPSGGAWTQVGASTTGPTFTSTFDTTTVADGTYDFRAIVSDAYGNETTVDVPNVTIDNTPPSIVSSVPADGSIVSSADSIVATTSEPVASVTSLRLDGLSATFTPTMSGTTLTFPTGTLAPGNHAVTGNLVDAVGNSMPFRINVTVNAGGGATPVTTKNTNDGSGPTTLSSADGSTLVTVPTDVWQSGAPQPHDWLVLKVNPSPAPWEIPASSGTMPGAVVDVRLFWDLAGTEEHHFDAPIQIDLIDPSGTSGTPATAEVGASWSAIPELAQAGTLPSGQPDGYWRTGSTVHVLTRHLSLFTVLVGVPSSSLPSSGAGSTPTTTGSVPPPIDFTGVFATDGLTLRWAPGLPTDQLSGYVLYADGKQIGTYGPTTYEAKLGPTSADDARRFTIVERSTSGASSDPSQALRVVPAVAGLSFDQASAALSARHFLPGQLVAVPSTAPPGTVVGPTDLELLPEGSTVDLQVADTTVARSPFAFSVASAPTVAVDEAGELVTRVALTTRSRIDVTLDAYPYVRIHRWHFFHVPAGTKILRLPLGHRLKSGQYRLFWKATAEADHSVQRRITPLRIANSAAAPKHAAIVVVSSGRSVQAFQGSGSGLELLDASVEQAFLYATYHEVRGFVLDGPSFDPQTVKALLAVYPHRGVVVLTSSPTLARAAKLAGAATLPASASPTTIAALVAKLDD